MREYTFKRAKIRKPETWTLSDTMLSREGESITLSDVTEIMFEVAAAGRLWVNVLKLKTETTSHSLQCNDTFTGQNRQQFLALSLATANQLAASGSSAIVRHGKGAAIGGWMMAIAGLAFVLMGMFFLYGSFQNGHGLLNYVFGGGAILLGAFIIKMGEPWKAAPKEELSDLAQRLLNIQLAASRPN